MADSDQGKTAQLYRMVMSEHLCPFGLKSKFLLERKGYRVEDHPLTTRQEVDAFQQEQNVETTPPVSYTHLTLPTKRIV